MCTVQNEESDGIVVVDVMERERDALAQAVCSLLAEQGPPADFSLYMYLAMFILCGTANITIRLYSYA